MEHVNKMRENDASEKKLQRKNEERTPKKQKKKKVYYPDNSSDDNNGKQVLNYFRITNITKRHFKENRGIFGLNMKLL